MITSDPYRIPVYRALAIVSTVLSRDEQGELAHILVVDTTLSEAVEVVYDLRPAR